MNVERLLRLAAHLDTLPAEVFDMGHWAAVRECGTVCCALGHACAIPEFAAAGLRLDWGHGGAEAPEPGDIAEVHCPRPNHWGIVAGYAAAVAFFGIPIEHAWHLFAPEQYGRPGDPAGVVREDIRPAEVAARIRALVAEHAAGTAEGGRP